jgi:hypothetical protein
MPAFALRKELFWAIALKLLLLLSIKFAFFPQRLAADEAAQGVAERVATSVPTAPQTHSEEKP